MKLRSKSKSTPCHSFQHDIQGRRKHSLHLRGLKEVRPQGRSSFSYIRNVTGAFKREAKNAGRCADDGR